MNPPISNEEERAKWDQYYADLPLNEEDELTQRFNRELVDQVRGLLPGGGKILEAGCGGGWQSLALARAGYRVTLMDFSPRALAYARRVFERDGAAAEFIESDAIAGGAPEFDLVFNAGVLEHYRPADQVRFIQGMASRSRQYTLVLVPNRLCYWYWAWRQHVTAKGEWAWGEEIPVTSLSDVFKQAGLQYLGDRFMGQDWTEHFIAATLKDNPELVRSMIELHRTPVIPEEQKGYLVASLGSANPQPSPPAGWGAPIARIGESADLVAALADSLGVRARERENSAQLCRAVINGIENTRNRFRADLEIYRNQRAWQVMLLFRKVYALLLRSGASGRAQFFRWVLNIPWKKDLGLAEYDLSFPDMGQDMPKELWLKALAGPSRGMLSAAAPAQRKYDLVILPVFEFDFRYQRPQQLANQFARAGHRVFWISPSRTAKQDVAYEAIPMQPNVWEVRLRQAIPNLYLGEWDAASLTAISQSLSQLFRDREISESVALLQLPFWRQAGTFLKQDQGAKVVYDCIDHWDTFPQVGAFTRAEEPKLAAEADVLIVTANSLFEKHKRRGLAPLLVRNGADFEFFRSPGETRELGGIAKPIVGYFGAIAEWFDFDLVRRVAQERPTYSFVLIGGLGLEAKVLGSEISKLADLPNVHLLGHKSYDTIPAYLKQFDACMIPFRLNEVTMATDPVKLYEYLSQGKPVVCTSMGELAGFAELVYIAKDASDFARQLDAAIQEPVGAIQANRVKFAEANSWRTRYQAIDDAASNTFPLVSILIVCYNSVEFIRPCLDSILRNTSYPCYEVIAVDNASTDGTAEILAEYGRREPRIRVVPLAVNEGFARGNNRAAQEARGEYLAFLNADTIVTAGWIGRLIGALSQHSNCGLVGPVTNSAGNEMRINVPYSNDREMEVFAGALARSHRGEVTPVDVAPFFCALLCRAVWDRVGDLDESFGVGMFEDDDYSLRVRKAGFQVLCVEDCFIHHFGQGSFRQMDPAAYGRLFERNKRQFEEKWGTPWTAHHYRASVSGPSRQYVPTEFCRPLDRPGRGISH